MIYCDASLLVALLVRETSSDAAETWLRAQPLADLVASDWVGTEVASALALKRRIGELDHASHVTLHASGQRLLTSIFHTPVEHRHFVAAGERFVSAPPTGLRAGDSLHLAIVVDQGFGLATLDRRFAEVARQAGVAVETIGEP